jgi:hypothetical protein
MTSDKLSSLTRTAPVLSLLFVAAILFAGPLTTATATTTATEEEEKIIETQDAATEQLTESDRDVNGIEFTPRWGAVSTLEPDSVEVLFADCLEDEFAVSGQFIFESSDVIPAESFAVAMPDDSMMWLAVVENTHSTEDKAAGIGVICADENDGVEHRDTLGRGTRITIDNIVKQFIKIENNQIVNINQIINIRQQIIQNAVQIVNITGNNNTVNQIINQSATQIVNQNATSDAEINQIINQTAQQEAGVVIPEEEEEAITPPENETTTITPPENETTTGT